MDWFTVDSKCEDRTGTGVWGNPTIGGRSASQRASITPYLQSCGVRKKILTFQQEQENKHFNTSSQPAMKALDYSSLGRGCCGTVTIPFPVWVSSIWSLCAGYFDTREQIANRTAVTKLVVPHSSVRSRNTAYQVQYFIRSEQEIILCQSHCHRNGHIGISHSSGSVNVLC